MNEDLLRSDDQYSNYIDYILSNLCFDDEDDENSICKEIIHHKKALDEELGRDAGIEVALVDYLKNINSLLRIPDILNSVDIRRLAHKGPPANHPKAFDASILSRDMLVEIERAHRYGSSFSLLLVDILIPDSLNSENIMGSLSSSFSTHVRLTDSVYTYGNNRYIFLLAETNVNAAIKTAFNLVRMILNPHRKRFSDLDYRIGAATFGSFKIDTVHKLLTAVDKALCEALKTGSRSIFLYHGKDILVVNEEGQAITRLDINRQRTELSGFPIHHGLAMGNAFVYNDILSHELESYDISEDSLEDEFERIERAVRKVEKDIDVMEDMVNRELSSEHAVIIQAHRLILNDVEILDEIKTQLFERKINAEDVIRDVFKRWENRFLAFDDEIFRSKSQDIADISRRIITELQGIERHILEDVPENSIIFSARLLPSDTVHINKNNVKAVITREGGHFSHSAVIAKAMNIPMIVLEDLELTEIQSGSLVFLDGTSGKVIIHPDDSEQKSLKIRVDDYYRKQLKSLKSGMDTCELLYMGEPIRLNAVIFNRQDTLDALSFGADGIGLFRMEVLYMTTDSMPDETWLLEKLNRILEPFHDKEITIRLLDIGGDKSLPYMDISERYNSFLGVRGIRLLIKYPQLLEAQMRVCLKLSLEFNIRVLIPMVTLVEDVLHVKKLYMHLKNVMKIKSGFPIGTMIETPAAVIAARAILAESDFVSIGTNDLIQYTMAADREKLNVSQYFEQGNVAIQEYIRIICELTAEMGKSSSLCGDLAQNSDYLDDLLRAGCRNFTVVPAFIPLVRQKILKICKNSSVN